MEKPPDQPESVEERAVRVCRDIGLEVGNFKEFATHVQQEYKNPSVDEVTEREMHSILAHDPKFFLKNQISLQNVSQRLAAHYANVPELVAQYGSPERVVNRVEYSFKVWLSHVTYFLVDSPDTHELRNAVRELQRILDGSWRPEELSSTNPDSIAVLDINSIAIPNVYVWHEDDLDIFLSYETILPEVERILPFLTAREQRKAALTIANGPEGDTARDKATRAKQLFEKYLEEARRVACDTTCQVPAYYDSSSSVTQEIVRLREGLLL